MNVTLQKLDKCVIYMVKQATFQKFASFNCDQITVLVCRAVQTVLEGQNVLSLGDVKKEFYAFEELLALLMSQNSLSEERAKMLGSNSEFLTLILQILLKMAASCPVVCSI